MGEHDLRFRAYSLCVIVVALSGTVASWVLGPRLQFGSLLVVIAAATIVSELLAVNLPNGGSVSLTYPLNVSAIVMLGPVGAAAVAVVATIPYLLPRGHTRPTRIAFNLGQTVISALVPAWAYFLTSGGRLLAGPDTAVTVGSLPSTILPMLLAASLGVVSNFALVGIGYALIHRVSLRRVWEITFSWMVTSQFALGLLGLAIAQVMAVEGPQGFALFVIPLVVARQMHSRYLSLREAYADTVRSLVAAIEAKDPYTKGHSVRVAKIAVIIARSMGLTDDEVDRLERAALLHDVGKIGISRAILAKPSSLSEAEYQKIREHPDIGARILESVPFLDDVRPVVQDHHERFDGAGYGHGLSATDIPLAARILAVADSFDAMTAERPYRSALSIDATLAEMQAGAGSQFDPAVVEVLMGALPQIQVDAIVPSVAREEAASIA